MTRLKTVFLPILVRVLADFDCPQYCYESSESSSVSINIMAVDQSFGGMYDWIVAKADDFMALHPSVSIAVVPVSWGDLADEALNDVSDGVNFYSAYVMMVGQKIGQLAPYLLDLTDLIVDNNGDINWNEIGSFYRSYQALYQGKIYVLPLDGDFQTLYYRMDYFEAHNMSVPRTLEEYVAASMYFNGTDLNGDGTPDYGSCFPHHNWASEFYFWPWVAQYTQYLGTSAWRVLSIRLAPSKAHWPLCMETHINLGAHLWDVWIHNNHYSDECHNTNLQPQTQSSGTASALRARHCLALLPHHTVRWEQAHMRDCNGCRTSRSPQLSNGGMRIHLRQRKDLHHQPDGTSTAVQIRLCECRAGIRDICLDCSLNFRFFGPDVKLSQPVFVFTWPILQQLRQRDFFRIAEQQFEPANHNCARSK